MDEPASLLVGHVDRDHLRITVGRRHSDSVQDWYEYGLLACLIEVRAGRMSGAFRAGLRAEGLAWLRDDLTELDQVFKPGIVTFEDDLTFSIEARGTGPIKVRGLAIDRDVWGNQQALTFEFDVEDALRTVLESARSVAAAYPPSPGSQMNVRSRGLVMLDEQPRSRPRGGLFAGSESIAHKVEQYLKGLGQR